MTELIVVGFVLAIALVGGGLLVWLLAVRAGSGEVARNAVAGVRTKATMASDDAWLAGQKAAEAPTAAGGKVSVASGVVSAVVALLLMLGAIDEPIGGALILAAALIGVVAMFVLVACGAVFGNRAAKDIAAR